MATPDVSNNGSLEAQADEPVVAGMIGQNRSRLDATARYVDRAGEGTSGVVRILGAVGRFPLNVIGTASGEVVRAARETVESFRNSADAGKKQRPSDTNIDSIAA